MSQERGSVVSFTGTLIVEECCNCHIRFAIPQDLHDQLVAEGPKASFWCPRGHTQHFTVREIDKLRAQLERTERQRDWAETSAKAARDQAAAAERSRAAIKGQLTKVKKRIGNGTCPCCNRSFANVARHMSTQHPDYAEETP